jgi:hypothetical protein
LSVEAAKSDWKVAPPRAQTSCATLSSIYADSSTPSLV